VKRQFSATCLLVALVLAGNVRAQNFDDALASGGLTAAEANLAAEDLTAETAFLLGGIQFLRGFEAVFQVRYENFGPVVPMVPGMLNDLPPNPDVSFDPAFVETAMARALDHFDDALETLAAAVDGEFAIELNLRDFWFDIDADGARAPWEGLIDVLGEFNSRPGVDAFDGTVRFDTADAEWLAAYVHVVSGVAEIVLALDPTPAITRVYDGRRMLDELGAIGATPFIGDDTVLDIAAGALLTMQGVPDRRRTRAALAHFKAMVAHNREFWAEVAEETDDDNEWLPNAAQTSAMGLGVGADTALAWENVLDEIDAILDGELLIPYWRLRRIPNAASGVGLNLRRLMEEPGDMDIILWIQGTAVAPFLEQGALADMGAWRQFLTMTPGNSILFAFWFN
jgi:hypothetical protein